MRGFQTSVIQSWSRGSEVLYGYHPAEAVGRVEQDLLASIYPVPIEAIEELLRQDDEWLGAIRNRRKDGVWITVLASWRIQRGESGAPVSIHQVALPLAVEREAGAARELVLNGTVARLERQGVGQTAELKELDDVVAGLRRRGLGQIAELEARAATVARLEQVRLGQTAELEERDANVARLERVGVDQTAELVERDANVARLELTGVGQTAELEALDAFAYSVSHDLRTPLRAINGYAQALLEEHGATFAPEVLSDLNRIQNAATRMGLLIDDLLRLSRITRTVPVLTRVDLAELAREISGRLTAGNSGRTVVWNIPEHAWVRADKGLVEIALENLVGNAWKFTANVERTIISFSSAPSPEGQIFTLRDNGIGFDMTHVGRLFVPFSRLHSGKAFAGSGIGLAIVQRVVRRHGGRVWAESERNHGAAIHFTLTAPAEDV
jgi:signal transduction histidine kinase